MRRRFCRAKLREALPKPTMSNRRARDCGDEAFMGRPEIAKMKRGARLSNVGAGRCWTRRRCSGAGVERWRRPIDVAKLDPCRRRAPSGSAELLITPHTSGVRDRLWEGRQGVLLELWRDGLTGGNYLIALILRGGTEADLGNEIGKGQAPNEFRFPLAICNY